MFGIGMPEFIIILVVALVVIGPQKFPGMLRSLGRGLGELKRASNEIRNSVHHEMDKMAEETELKEVKETLENNFGGVATGLHGPFDVTDEKKMDALANAFEKNTDSAAEQSESSKSKEELLPSSSKSQKETQPASPLASDSESSNT